MITAQDIREKTFEKATFNGYAMSEVDDFLDELADDLVASQKEAAAMRAKMKVLVGKIEEYRASEEAMHMALVTAQKTAKSIEDEAQAKADALLADAQAKADALLRDAQQESDRVTGHIRELREAEELRLEKAREVVSGYFREAQGIAERELALLAELKDKNLIDEIVPVEEEPVEEEPAEDAPVEEAPVEEEPVEEEPAAALPQDFLRQFEEAVYSQPEIGIPDAEEGDEAPMFRF